MPKVAKNEILAVDKISSDQLLEEFCYGCTDDGEWEPKDEEEILENSFRIISVEV